MFYDTNDIKLNKVNNIITTYNTFAKREGSKRTERIESIEDIKRF